MGKVEPLIHRRIRAALECARWRKLPVRSIYLDEADWAELDRVASKRHGSCPVVRLSFDDHPIACVDFDGQKVKPGTSSRVYLKTGVAIAVPKRLSKRVGP